MRKRGFTLVEIMIVVSVIVLLAAISIPNVLRARINANESAAIQTLKAYCTALQSYAAANPTGASISAGYPFTIASLRPPWSNPPYLDPTLITTGTRQGYQFLYARTQSTSGAIITGAGIRFRVFARPLSQNITGVRSFYMTESGVLCSRNPGTQDIPVTPPVGQSCPAGYNPVQ